MRAKENLDDPSLPYSALRSCSSKIIMTLFAVMATMHETSNKCVPTSTATRSAKDFSEACEIRDLCDATDRRLSGDSRLLASIVEILAARLVGAFEASLLSCVTDDFPKPLCIGDSMRLLGELDPGEAVFGASGNPSAPPALSSGASSDST